MKRWLWILVALGCGACALQSTATPTAPALLRPLPSPTVAVTFPTPAIIATPIPPTPLPTPVTYVVEQGDTLISIAWTFGVTVEALQAANPAVDERFLSVGTVLIIPGPANEATPAPPTATPEPIALTLSAPACYPAPTGPLYCFVEARNADSVAVGNVSVQIVLADVNGLPLADARAASALQIIPPNGSAPLVAVFDSPPAGVAAQGARLLSAQRVSDPVRAGYFPLDVSSSAGAQTGAGWMATGRVRNASGVVVSAVWVTMTLYDAEGVLVGYRTEALAGLAPGEEREFTVVAASLGGAVAHHTLAAEARP